MPENSEKGKNTSYLQKSTKYIFVTGGVLSGLGKGLIAASIGKLLQEKNYTITPIKCDGYLNVDPGTMNPNEHGEVYVLKDGTEVDMDFGHYERFLNTEMTGEQNLTSGRVFQKVIQKERNGEYLGETVQMIPHVTNHIKKHIKTVEKKKDSDIVIIEIGGTVGDIENQLYLETVRQIQQETPPDQTIHVHSTLVPYLETVGEQKTKPTQHSVKKLRETGLNPDIIVGRSSQELTEKTKEKISLFCDVELEEVISDPDLETVYELPIKFKEQNIHEIISRKLQLNDKEVKLEQWEELVRNIKQGEKIAEIAIAGKYTEMDDTYASVEEALKHAAAHQGGKVDIHYIDTAKQDYKPSKELQEYDGVIIPGGFGTRGVEGKIKTAEYCRNQDIPLLGLCYGMQIMAIEYARNQLKIPNAASEEFDYQDSTNIVAELPGQKDIEQMGGTMRLGNQEAKLDGKVKQIYGKDKVEERHRHRYELKPDYAQELDKQLLKISGENTSHQLPEYIEHRKADFYIGTQAHPEFTSTLEKPNPLYAEFIKKQI